MTRQALRPQETFVDISGCLSCRSFTREPLFDTCTHERSTYKDGPVTAQHTCQHMRSEWGPCGPDRRLYK